MAALGLITSAFAEQHQLKYHVTPIAVGSGEGVNDKGDVVGTLDLGPITAFEYENHQHAFLYKKGKITDLGVFVDPRNPPNNTYGNAVNDSDVVVGNIIDHGPNGTSEGRLDAFLWRNGQLIDIAQGTTDGGAQATAVAINNSGDVVGSYDAGPPLHLYPGFGFSHAYLYRNNLLTDIGTLGGSLSYGRGINNADQIVGTSTETPGLYPQPPVSKAFLYSNGRMVAIGGAQSSNFGPAAINDNGWVTGTLFSSDHSENAVLYINGRFLYLGNLPGFVGSEGVSINNSGVAVGNLLGNVTATYTYDGTIYTYSYVASTGVFVYNGRIQNLNDLVDGGWKITAVGHINDAGQIAATGNLPGSTEPYALLLTKTKDVIK
jgi:probable HAF family extracellular repeat protein